MVPTTGDAPLAHGIPALALVIAMALALSVALPTAMASAQEAGEPVTETVTETGYCDNPASDARGAVWEGAYAWAGRVLSAVAVLTWTDDEGSRSDPDAFALAVSDAAGASDGAAGSTGSVEASVEGDDLNATWTVRVELTQAGATPVGPFGIIARTDPGNSWSLRIDFTYTPEPEDGGPGGPPPNVEEVLASPIFKAHIVLMVFSTAGFLTVGLLAGVFLITRRRWADDPSRLRRMLASPRPYRALAPHIWFAFFIASVPIGIWVAGRFYGWGNAWTSLPVVWNPGFWDITNADHSSLLVMTLWALPMWLNRREILARDPHVRFWRWSAWMRRRASHAPPPRFSDREMALIYFFLGILVFFLFMVQPHGN